MKKNGWSKYGLLVNESGLIPNKFDKTKYDEKELCELFINIIREIGIWPSRGVLDVKHYTDKRYPESKTFYSKLGQVRNLALPKKIIEYVEDRKGYEHIINICNSVIEQYKDEQIIFNDGIINYGYIYLGKQQNVYKIGKSKDPQRRREDITLQGPTPFESVHEIETDDMNGLEQYWHKRFASKNIRGEWYKLNSSDVKAFKRWRKIY